MIDLRDLNLEWLRSQIGCVMQEPVLFASSIKQNLLLGNIDALDEEIEKALIKAEAFEFIYDLKDKLDTYVGSGGGQLSGGQKQRIAIARALLKKPKLLLLDEATSALDRSSERQIMKTLNNFSKDFIIINVTHRKRTLNDCQKVYVFKDKKINKTIINKDSIKMIKSSNTLKVPDCNDGLPDNPSKSPWKTLNNLSIESRSLFLTSKTICNDEAEQDKEDEEELDSSFSRIMDYLADKKCLLFFGFLAATIDGVVFPTVGLILSKIIVAQLKYNLNKQYFKDQIYKFCILMGCLAVGGAVICAIRQLIFVILAESSVRKIKDKAFEKVINMPLSWFQKEQNQPETVTQKITTSCKVLYKFCQNYISHIYTISVNTIFSITLALYFQWRTGLTSLGMIPLIFLSQGLQMKFIQGYSESKGKIYSQSSQIVSESIMNIRTSFSLGGPQAFTKKYSQKIDVVHSVHLKNSIFSGFMFGLSYMLQYVCFALMFFLAAVYIKDNNLDIDGSMSAIFLIIFASISAGNQSAYLQDISSAKASAATIFSIIDMQDEHEKLVKSGSKLLKVPIKGNIQFIDVSFKYMNRVKNVLESISFRIKQGQKIAFVGLSGSGKSTIIKLLQGFYTPSSGTILLEGIDIRDYDLHHLRKSFGIVSQEPVLFNQSIEDNIRYNLTEASHQDIVKVAREANFNPDSQQENTYELNVNPISGFEKNVGPKGSHVSGGQKQRIAIARALLRQPKVLLLDQATSALDAENETKIQQALNRIMQEKTTLNITHRLESTQKMDKIFVIEDGAISESGNYRDLMQKASLFLQMHQGNMQPI